VKIKGSEKKNGEWKMEDVFSINQEKFSINRKLYIDQSRKIIDQS
jgi:hypothetical protein